jgi:hypothetical protein
MCGRMDEERNSVATKIFSCIVQFLNIIFEDSSVKITAALWKRIYAFLKWQCEI